MISEVYILGQRLDLYEDESITVKQVSKDLKDISKIFADFSQSFNVPASANNNNIFKHYYNANIDGGYDARTRKVSNLVVGGLDFKQGKMRLDSVEIINNVPANYKITFFGNVISIKDKIGDDKLFNLDWLSNFDHNYNGTQVELGLTNGLSFTVDGVSFPRAIIYPLISYKRQFFYNSASSDHTNTDTHVNIAYHSGHNGASRHGVEQKDLKPAIRLSVIVKAIEEQYGFKFNSPFFNTTRFVGMYMNLNKSVEVITNGFVEVEDISGTLVPLSGEVPLEWMYRLEIAGATSLDEQVDYKRKIYFNDQLIYQDVNFVNGNRTIEVSTTIGNDSLLYQVRSEIITEEDFDFEAETRLRKRYVETFQVVFTNPLSLRSIVIQTRILQNLQDIKVFEFLTGLFKTFNLIAYAENDEIIIDDLQSYYANGRIIDVTEFIETKKETVKRGEFFKEINFKFQESKQIIADEFKQSNNQGYGDLDFVLSDENGDPLQDVDGEKLEVKSIFENPIYERLNDLDDGSPTPIQYCLYTNREIKPIVGKPFLFYLIKPSISSTPISFIKESSNLQTEIDTPIFMPSHSMFTVDSFNLNFNAEISEYTGEVMQDTIYNRYWGDYVGDMFSIKRRTFLMEGILPVNLLNNLKLSDRLIIKGNRYIINSISSNIVDRKDTLELINDIYDAPIRGDVLTSSFLRQTLQKFSKDETDFDFNYIGFKDAKLQKVDLGDATTWFEITSPDVLPTGNEIITFTVDENTSGSERVGAIKVRDDINSPQFIIIQEA